MAGKGPHCSFVLLAEFDIDSGAQLTYQFPQPLGTDEGLLANLMLPDGAERHLEDWTIFFLNQTPFNTIAPVLALETESSDSQSNGEDGRPELLYVLNLVRTKHDKSVRRGAVVKAMAICTRHPFIQIFKPVLLLALDDYFANPSQECLARLFDAINSMNISAAPALTRCEKLIMRASERKDIFADKFSSHIPPLPLKAAHKTTGSNGSHSSEDGVLIGSRTRSTTAVSDPNPTHPSSPSDSSFSLGGSAVWVNDDSAIIDGQVGVAIGAGPGSVVGASVSGGSVLTSRGRRSTDTSSNSSHAYSGGAIPTSSDPHLRSGMSKDTHFFQTNIAYKGHTLPIKLPLATFPEEVGEYSLIQLIQTFSTPLITISGPLHPHLHTNGSLTHPIIILFNALVTGKRILFLGHNIPAGQVANYVLSACALGSGCGAVLRGFIERSFPYAGLAGGEDWVSTPAYIAGVTNPIFETSGSWDLLMDIGTARVVVHKDIHLSFPPTMAPPALVNPMMPRPIKAENSTGSEDDIQRIATRDGKDGSQKSEFAAKPDCLDNMFIEDLISAITSHFGETLVRMRFTEYVARFIRLASRYEEVASGSTKLGCASAPFVDGSLGSGIVFPDDVAAFKELATNASRIEGWRRSKSYQYCVEDFRKYRATAAIQGFDLSHQLSKLRLVKNLPDAEVELIVRSIADSLRTYEQVVELLAYMPPHAGGLQPLSFCLFHHQESIREATVDIFNVLRQNPVGVIFLQALNHFQRYAYVRQAHARESRVKDLNHGLAPPPHLVSRTPSNRSEVSLGVI
ncbi:docking domain of Afi1 for Arf3 in vesicle trafficking-domain-containing protein [Suillus clintonianus]|uniref:docking domain of Afi1 for Arf3 in vesicle trafficking-domain-containing protein n=1 Tax=Suillus clintonianus TaxID=1904413 RepID=UPI001B86EFF9|nr:docking domain of Afi1 for Arf3 in vesicle trafficking-domain-containing protein [Suillus clintonianus]KAG2136725.1 docking domain of Afi1 for Arf3 in vesicle trafficking-domain-containing protein [Suillus clintonianus]